MHVNRTHNDASHTYMHICSAKVLLVCCCHHAGQLVGNSGTVHGCWQWPRCICETLVPGVRRTSSVAWPYMRGQGCRGGNGRTPPSNIFGAARTPPHRVYASVCATDQLSYGTAAKCRVVLTLDMYGMINFDTETPTAATMLYVQPT